MLRGLVKVSMSVSRNYSTSHLSDMRGRGRGGSANYDDLSLISAQFHAEVCVVQIQCSTHDNKPVSRSLVF